MSDVSKADIENWMAGLPELPMSQDWNGGKLRNRTQTTIRPQHNVRYQKGANFRIGGDIVKKMEPFAIEIAAVIHCQLGDLTVWELALDTGYSKRESLDMFSEMYKHRWQGEPKDMPVSYILYIRMTEAEIAKRIRAARELFSGRLFSNLKSEALHEASLKDLNDELRNTRHNLSSTKQDLMRQMKFNKHSATTRQEVKRYEEMIALLTAELDRRKTVSTEPH